MFQSWLENENQTKKKLLFLVNVDWFFITHRLPIAKKALSEGYDVYLLTNVTKNINDIKSLGIKIVPLKINRSNALIIPNLLIFLKILFYFFKIQPDIIHLVTVKPVLFGGIAARIARIPFVVSAITGLGYVFTQKGFLAEIRKLIVEFIYKIALGHKNIKIIFQNQHDRYTLVNQVNIPLSSTTIIKSSGVNLNTFYPQQIPEGRPIVVLASRMLIEKGIREFVISAESIINEGYDVRFVLVGKPDLEYPNSISYEEINSWVSQNTVEWWGHRNDIHIIFGLSSIVVLPSYYSEGLPKVLVEAAACGRPIITSDHPGCKDAIIPDVTGLLVPICNSNALTRAILKLINNPQLIRSMGIEGRKYAVNNFSEDLIVDQHLDIYNKFNK